MKISEVNFDAVCSSISNQLWRYYDVDMDVDTVTLLHDDQYLLSGSTEHTRNEVQIIKCKIFYDKVEDLYLFDGHGFIEPTTTVEEQNAR